jgi:crotonobetainyl-CoA:carnitine CoA-transferase CaiB-like acyl-CoA transferase
VNGPLEGVVVVDLSFMISGPYVSALLADQGADVIKVERPVTGDVGRFAGASVAGMSAIFVMCNRGKRSIVIDLQQPEGVRVLLELVRRADVVVQNYRHGVAERLGFDYRSLQKVNENLIYLSISAFGSEGPYRRRGAFDAVLQAYSGVAVNQADPHDSVPTLMRQSLVDKVTSLYATQAVTAALFARERGSGGQHIEVSMADAAISFLWTDAAGNEVLLGADGTQPSSPVAGLQPMRFADGWGVIQPVSPADFAAACRVFGVEHLADRVTSLADRIKNRSAANEVVDQWHAAAASMTVAEADQRLDAENLPFAMVLTNEQLAADPHAVATGIFEYFEHPVAGPVRIPRHPTRFGHTPSGTKHSAPGLGEHTEEILTWLGLSHESPALRERGAIA